MPYSANAYVVDYKNPHAITDVINHVENGKYGSVTKDIDAHITRKMQILGPYFAPHPSLINKYLKGVTDHEETHPSENIEVTGMSHQNVINFDSDRRHIQKDVAAPKREKDVPAAPILVFNQVVWPKPIFHRVVLPKRIQTPAIKMIVSFALRFFMEHIIFKHIESCVFYAHSPNDLPKNEYCCCSCCCYCFPDILSYSLCNNDLQEWYHAPNAYHGESSGLKPKISLPPTYSTRKDKGVYVGVHKEKDNKVGAEDNSVYGRVQEEEDNKVDGEDTCVYTGVQEEEDNKVDDKGKGVYVGVQEEEDNKVDAEDDGLEDMWREMSMAIETSKVWLHYFDFTFQL